MSFAMEKSASSPIFPQAISLSPSQHDSLDESVKKVITSHTVIHAHATMNHKQCIIEEHQARMKDLRKELDYLKETDWKNDPIEKYIGQ